MKTTLYKGSTIVAGEFISNIPPARIVDIVRSLRPFTTTPSPQTPLGAPIPPRPTSSLGLPVGRHAWRYLLTDEQQLKPLLDRRNFPGYGYVEPNYVVRGQEAPVLSRPAITPLLRRVEWWIRNDGQQIDGLKGTNGIDINALEAWAIAKGSRNVAVAVLDSGLDIYHADIAPNLWSAQRPFRLSVNGTSYDCGPGYKQINGVNCTPSTPTIPSTPFDVTDAHAHGTRMAGIVGAVHGSGGGSTGVCPRVTLIPIKVLDSQLYGTIDSVVNGLDCALQIAECGLTECMRLTVVLASWGFWSVDPSAPLQEMLTLLRKKNMLVVCSAFNCQPDELGNLDQKRLVETRDGKFQLDYYLPAFTDSNLLAVTASDHCDQLVAGYGPTRIDIRAPGYAINSPTPGVGPAPGIGCSTVNGASAAAALAAGVAALVQSRCPQITAAELRDCLINSTTAVSSQPGLTAHGRLNALGALLQAPCASGCIPDPNPLPYMSADCYEQLQSNAGSAQPIAPWAVKWELEQTSDEYGGRPNQRQKAGDAGDTVEFKMVGGKYGCYFSRGGVPTFASCSALEFKFMKKVDDVTLETAWKQQDFTTAEKSTVEYWQLAQSIKDGDYSYYEAEGELPMKDPTVKVKVLARFVPIMELKGGAWFTHFMLVLVNKGEVWPPVTPLGMQGGVLHGSGNNG